MKLRAPEIEISPNLFWQRFKFQWKDLGRNFGPLVPLYVAASSLQSFFIAPQKNNRVFGQLEGCGCFRSTLVREKHFHATLVTCAGKKRRRSMEIYCHPSHPLSQFWETSLGKKDYVSNQPMIFVQPCDRSPDQIFHLWDQICLPPGLARPGQAWPGLCGHIGIRLQSLCGRIGINPQ